MGKRNKKKQKQARAPKQSEPPVVKRKFRRRKPSKFGKDKRRKHRHWQVTVFYRDGEKFARVYIDKDKAARFAKRQRRSPVVRATRIRQIH